MILFFQERTGVKAWATLSRTFSHEPMDVQMKQTSTVFCHHFVIKKHQINEFVETAFDLIDNR